MKKRSRDQGKGVKAFEGFWESLVDAAQVLIIVLDTEGRIVLFNRACQEITGYSAAEALGHDWLNLLLPERIRKSANAIFQEILAGQSSEYYETPILTKDGQERVIEWNHVFLYDEEGAVRYVIGAGHDVTEHKRLEETLKRRVEQLAVLNRTSQAVTASLELNQVLAEIVSLAGEVVASDYAGVVLVDKEGKVSQSAEDLPGVPTIGHRIRTEGFTHWIVQSRRPIIIDDIGEDGTVTLEPANEAGSAAAPCTANPLLVEAGVKSLAGLPLLAQDRLLGVLYLHSLRPGNFRDQLPLLTTFANQAAIALENARLYQAERKRATQLAVVNQVARQIASILDLDQLLQKVVAAIQQGFHYYNVTLFLLNNAADELEMRAIAGGFKSAAPSDYRQAVGEGIIGRVAETGQPLLANDVSQEPHYIPGFLKEPLTGAELCVPLKLAGQVTGVLDVQDTRLNAFDEMDLVAMETLADQIAVAIENARLYEKEKRQKDRLARLSEISRSINARLNLRTVLAEVVEAATLLLNTKYSTLFLLDTENQVLIPYVTCGHDWEQVKEIRFALGEGLAGWVAETGQPLNVTDTAADPRFVRISPDLDQFISMLLVPLIHEKRVVGVLTADRKEGGAFSEEDQLLLATLADQAAVAIENARLYELEQTRRRIADTLREVSSVLSSTLALGDVLHLILEQLENVVTYDTASVAILRGGVLEISATRGYANTELVMSARLPLAESAILRQMMRGKEAMVIADVREDERWIWVPGAEHVRSWIGVPLLVKDRMVGALMMDKVEPNFYSPQDAQLVSAFANQAAIAIENAQLYLAQKEEAEISETLLRVADTISTLTDPNELLKTTLKLTVELLKADRSIIWLWDEEQGVFFPREVYGFPESMSPALKDLKLNPGEVPILEKLLRHKTPVAVEDVRGSALIPQALKEAFDLKSILGVPVIYQRQLLGVLGVSYAREVHHFTEKEIAIATGIADQTAVAIENARLFEAEAQRRQEAETLRQAAMALTSTLDLEETLDRILEQLHRVVAYDSASVQLLRDGHLEIVGGRGFADPSAVIGLRFPVPGDNPNTRVIERGEPVILADAQAAHAPFREPPHDHIRSWLGVPMRFREQIIGLITLDSTELGHFTADHARLAAAFANQAAIAIENARLYEQVAGLAAELEARVQERTAELMRKARDLSLLYQAGVDLASSLERSEVLNILARQAALVVDAVDCAIYEIQDDALVVVARRQTPALLWKDSEGDRRYPLADYPATREAIEKGQPLRVRVDDPLADKAECARLQELGYTTLLQVHIVSQDKVVGVVEVFDNRPEREFGEDDAALLQTIANQASMAIEKARLFQQVREERNHLELLYEVSRKLSASLELEQTLRDILQISVAATGASRGSVFVFDDEGHLAHRILTQDLSPARADDVPARLLYKGLAGWVLKHEQPAIVSDTNQDERWLPFPNDAEPVRSAMAVPLIEGDQVRGLLVLVHPQPHHFNQAHLELFSSIAHQLAVIIERARLYEETRRRAQEIAQQKEQTDAIMRSMADGLIVTDLENKLVLANPAAEEMLQFKLEEAIGQEIEVNIRHDRLRQIVYDTLDKQQAGYEMDIELTDLHEGAQRIVRAHTAMVNDSAGQPMGIVTTLRDVTHEREVQRLKDELISTVSHELRTPMTSVLGFSELLLTRQLSEEKQQLYIQTIHKEAQRLSALINDFLDIQRMEKGQQEYHFKEVDLGQLVHEMVVAYSSQSEVHTLTLDLPPELPLIQADPNRLKQVISNLLSNAIKFSPEGGRVAVSIQVWDDTVQVAVSDEGIGIPTEALPHIFEKFFRVDSSDRREIKGTGLGLAICKEIVEAHGGSIWAESQVGTGTTVTFSLPLVITKRILVVDDEEDIREMFRRLLGENYKVLTAADGQEGLSLMEKELPDLVILDIAMPVMNGYQFLEKMKGTRRTKDIPVIAISGVDTDIDRLNELGADEFLSKPFSTTVLLDTMQRLLKRS